MSSTIQRIPSLSRLSLSRGNSQHGAGSAHGANAALLLLAGTAASPRTLVLRACPRAQRGMSRRRSARGRASKAPVPAQRLTPFSRAQSPPRAWRRAR